MIVDDSILAEALRDDFSEEKGMSIAVDHILNEYEVQSIDGTDDLSRRPFDLLQVFRCKDVRGTRRLVVRAASTQRLA